MESWVTALICIFGTIGALIFLLVVLVMTLFLAYRIECKRKGYVKTEGLDNYVDDMVYLHQFPRAKSRQVPNMSPFAMKLETWLRLHRIPYKNVETLRWSKKKQSPFIVMNGEEIADSNFVIKHLTKVRKMDPKEGLTDDQWSAARAFLQLVEGSLTWSYFYYRYTDHPDIFAKVFNISTITPLAKMIRFFMKKGIKRRCYEIGIGRHSIEDIYDIGKDDIRAISRYLGTKKYLMGDEMKMVDCSIFGHLSQILYVTSLPYPHRFVMEEECTNLVDYVNRIKEKLWPDWDNVTEPGEFS